MEGKTMVLHDVEIIVFRSRSWWFHSQSVKLASDHSAVSGIKSIGWWRCVNICFCCSCVWWNSGGVCVGGFIDVVEEGDYCLAFIGVDDSDVCLFELNAFWNDGEVYKAIGRVWWERECRRVLN